jgi:hypothetical protein
MPVRQTHTFIRVPSTKGDRLRVWLVASVLSVIFGSTAAMLAVKFSLASRPTVVQQAPTAVPDSIVLSASDTSTAPLPADPLPVGPRAPIGLDPAQMPKSRRRRSANPDAGSSRDSTAATVYSPGAAPIPRVSGGSPDPMPTTQDISMRDSAASLRTELAARRHRVDSLAQVVDSLGRPR